MLDPSVPPSPALTPSPAPRLVSPATRTPVSVNVSLTWPADPQSRRQRRGGTPDSPWSRLHAVPLNPESWVSVDASPGPGRCQIRTAKVGQGRIRALGVGACEWLRTEGPQGQEGCRGRRSCPGSHCLLRCLCRHPQTVDVSSSA